MLVPLSAARKTIQIIKHLHAAGIDPSKAVTALVLCIGAPLLLLLLRPHTYARHRTRVIMLMYELPWQLLLTCQAVSFRPIARRAAEERVPVLNSLILNSGKRLLWL